MDEYGAVSERRASWLCPTERDRARAADNSARINRALTVTSVAVGLTLLYGVPDYGWWLLIPFVLAAVNTRTLDLRMRRSAAPEYHAAFSVLWTQCIAASVAALTGGPHSPMLPLLVIPPAFAAIRFRETVSYVATGISAALILVVTFGLHPASTIAHPAFVIVVLAVLIGISAAGHALSGAELFMRDAAILDPLTGLLNRQGLARRFEELAEQAHLTDAPISLLVCDLDRFKEINDRHGHAVGDAVLRDVAYEMRKQLRSFELIYRIGGEEFLVLLPGASAEDAMPIGQRLCESLRRSRAQRLATTISIGIATGRGEDLDYHTLFAAADAALYLAKSKGRDRVVQAPVEIHDQRAKLGSAGKSFAATANAGL